MAKILSRISQPSLRQGVLFGLILGAIEIALWFAGYFAQNSLVLFILSLSALLVGGCIAGQRAARETSRLGTGILAGVWAGLIGCLLEALLLIVIQLVTLPTYVAAYQQEFKGHPTDFPGMKYADITASYVLTGFAINLLVQIIFYILIALVGGAIGGFLGRWRASAYVGVEPQAKMAMESERGTDMR